MENKKKIGISSDGREMHHGAGVLLTHKGKYLLLDRVNPPLGFACPAGHIDEGEDSRTTAIREVFEETGIKLENVEFVLEEEVLWNFCGSAPSHYWYLYKAESPTEKFKIEANEAKSMNWYTIEEIKKLNLEPVWRYWFEKMKII